MNDISIFSEIDYQSRRNFLNYLNRISLPKSVIEENIRTFDKLVIDSFPKSAALSPKATSDYIYNGEDLFLLYINNYEMASLFSKTTEKEELYWNFKNINDSQLANQVKSFLVCKLPRVHQILC
jgi:elongation factor P--beta-lysine ligase